MSPSVAVLGFRPHTYWTAVVALTGDPDAPQVVERRRVVFAIDLERFIYHQAAEADPAQAVAMIAGARAATEANAAHEIATLIAELQLIDLDVRAAVAPAGTAKVPGTLSDILRSHSAIHAAEGNFYRDVVAAACQAVGLQVHRVFERDLPGLVAARLGVYGAELDARLKAMGAALGPPWSEDYRLATLAAWSHLDAH